MLKYRKGDLITAAKTGEVHIIAHQCNCFCNMGRGIAPLIAKAFPEAREVDNCTAVGDKEKLGSLTMGYNREHEIFIFNLYGQYGHWKKEDGSINTDYDALRRSLTEMAKWLDEEDTIGLPKLGCGLGGGEWNIVEKIIEETLSGLNVTVYEL